MPTNHPRIQVTNDPLLAQALRRAERLVGHEGAQAKLVRDLAIRGADAIAEEHGRRGASLDYLARVSTERTGLDWELLERIDEEAWRLPAE